MDINVCASNLYFVKKSTPSTIVETRLRSLLIRQNHSQTPAPRFVFSDSSEFQWSHLMANSFVQLMNKSKHTGDGGRLYLTALGGKSGVFSSYIDAHTSG